MPLRSVLLVLLVAYIPGALIFRLPIATRARRAARPAEERVLWGVLLSTAVSSIAALGLAAAGRYRFERLMAIDAAIALLLLAIGRTRLRLGAEAPAPRWSALVPLTITAAGLWMVFLVPPSEYLMGGKDPGVYLNEGIQIAQRGGLIIRDQTVKSLPPLYRDLFFERRAEPTYYSNRFMGFFLLDPGPGTVVGQFPHLYPTWIAVGYDLNGLTGARQVDGVFAVLGMVLLYFLARQLIGPAGAVAAAALLMVHVVQLWYARYPNAEMVMQPLVFAGLLAYLHADADGDSFFAPVSAVLIVLCVFTHVTGLLAVISVGIAAMIAPFGTWRTTLSFWIPLVIGTLLAAAYLANYIPPYFEVPIQFIGTHELVTEAVVGASVAAAGIALLWLAARYVPVARRVLWARIGLVGLIWALAIYAYYVRTAAGLLAEHDADSLRTFTAFYLTPYGLVAALIGVVVIAYASPSPIVVLATIAVFSTFTFYKIRIVPEHFWAARRFVAVIVPAAMLLVAAAAFGRTGQSTVPSGWRWWTPTRLIAGVAVFALLGWHFAGLTQPILHHVEYAGLIPRLERLRDTFGDDDLVLVEARAASDVHVLALPLAYVYARNVLVFASATPNKSVFRDFLDWAHARYRRVFFVGGGGTELLSRAMTIESVRGERFQIPEYESALNAYPTRVKQKEFDLSIYEFLPRPVDAPDFRLDVGTADDLYVRRFHAKEKASNGTTFRWSRERSYVSIVGPREGCRRLIVSMSGAGRPAAAGGASVELFLDDRRIGSVTVGSTFVPYGFDIPLEVADRITRSEEGVQLRLESNTWSPRKLLGTADDRLLGVMVDRVDVECGSGADEH